jgi:hypothetical protein
MTTEQLDALPPGSLLYIPTPDDVLVWEFAGPVHNRSWYTLNHPPDQNGEINNRRPVYVAPIELLHAALDEKTAWEHVRAGLYERIDWINKRKLNEPAKPIPAES